ncbi:toll/interleukin-1 receptor domain-containing protein [Candidatus Entotheonella palauensis]|nr:toll/interleukin-1 receptor domain-containing protein [Candidatus Entotheonella palauensis]
MPKFDCFLSYNRSDASIIRVLKTALTEKGLSCWLDFDEVRPGCSWQSCLEYGIQHSASVAVCMGADGLGFWQRREMEAAQRFADSNPSRPVIPVLLPGASCQPDLPVFLATNHWVDMRDGICTAAVDALIWGITGEPPAVDASQTPVQASGAKAMPSQSVSCCELGNILQQNFDQVQLRLAHLHGQLAAFGLSAPPYIRIDAGQAEKDFNVCKQQLADHVASCPGALT